MMNEVDFKNMSNNEIKLELMKYENEYKSVQIKVLDMVERLKELDSLYNQAKRELNNRSKGIF